MELLTNLDLHGYSGIVYDRTAGRPMASAAVSNGRDVALTDRSGRYFLPGWDKADFITVTSPAGYWTEDYYIPVSEREDGYNFYLDRLKADLTDHAFLQVTDSEVGADGAGRWIEKLRQVAARVHPAFIIHTGDICYIDGLKAHIKDMNSENMGIPVRYVIGNHDYVNWGDYGEALFESIYGPVMYSFEAGRIHYIVTPIVHGDVRAKYNDSDVVTFVENDLKYVSPDKKVILFNHNYCAGDEIGFVLSDGIKKVDLREKNLLAWVFGHWHYNYLNEIDGIFNITTSRPDTGGIDASPAAIRSVVIKGGALAASDCCYNDFEETLYMGSCVWSTSLGANILFSAPAAGDGIVYVGTVDDGWPKDCAIVALREEDGEVLWRYRTKNSIKSDIHVRGGRVVTQDTEGNVYCLDLSGNEIWKKKVELFGPNNSSSGVAVTENYVYCGGQQQVYCLRALDGGEVWRRELSGGNTSPAGFVLHENILFVGAHWDKLYALDAATGETLWANNSDGLRYFIMTPAVYNGCLYAASWSRIYKIDIKSGQTLQCREIEGCTFHGATTPCMENGIMYLGTTNRGVAAIDTESLEVLWTFETGKNKIYTSPYSSGDIATVDSPVIPVGDALCFGASDGRLYLIDKSGGKIAEYEVDSPVNQAPIVDEKNIIIADFSGNVTCFSRSCNGPFARK